MSDPKVLVGSVLGHYRLIEQIGAGGMGVVYRAHDEALDRDVAITVLPDSTFDDTTARARLLGEARTASRLKHPHICTIYEVIGLLPLSTFARTEKGFEAGRKTFRLTLGGTDTAERLLAKTRRVLMDLNRMIAEESAKYNRHTLALHSDRRGEAIDRKELTVRWEALALRVREESTAQLRRAKDGGGIPAQGNVFLDSYLSERLGLFRQRMMDMIGRTDDLLRFARSDGGKELERLLERELYKDNLARRQSLFRGRPYDRTVHPTQMYSLNAELLWESALETMVGGGETDSTLAHRLSAATIREYAGLMSRSDRPKRVRSS